MQNFRSHTGLKTRAMGYWALIYCILLLCAAHCFGGEKNHILIIQSYHAELAWTGQCEQGIRSTLGPEYRVSIFYMDTKRLDRSEFVQRANMAWQAYEQVNPDLVMIGDDNGLALLGQRFAKTDTPVVYFGINKNPRRYFPGPFPRNITGVLERLPLFPWLRYLGSIMPRARKALVLMDQSPTSLAVVESTFQDKQTITIGRILSTYEIPGDWTSWQDRVIRGGYDMVIIPTFHSVKHEDGSYVDYRTVVEWTCANAGVPVFSLQDYTVGNDGATGAFVVSGLSHGALAGEIARKILEENRSPENISPLTDGKGKFFFNKARLAQFGLTLPYDIAKNALFR